MIKQKKNFPIKGIENPYKDLCVWYILILRIFVQTTKASGSTQSKFTYSL